MMRSLVGELADDGVELIEGEALVGGGLVVDVGAVEHLEDVVVVDRVVELLGDALELLEVDEPVLVLVEEREDAAQAVLGLGLADAAGDDVDELLLGDRLVLVLEPVDQVQHEGVAAVQSQLLQHLVDLHGVDRPAPVLVEHLEGVHQLLVVLRSQPVLPGRGHCLGSLRGGGGGLGRAACHSAHNIRMINNNFYYAGEGIGSGGSGRRRAGGRGGESRDQFEMKQPAQQRRRGSCWRRGGIIRDRLSFLQSLHYPIQN